MATKHLPRWSCGAFAVIAAVFVVHGGCSGDDPPTRAVGDGCSLASDCSDPLICAYARCHAQCTSTKDCPASSRCVGSDYPKLGICMPEDEYTCERNSDCAPPLVCGRRSHCEKQCTSSRDCLSSQVCSIGSCADVIDVPDAGGDVPRGETGETCLHNSDCNEPLVCKGGFCTEDCATDRDCAGGQRCMQGLCVSGLGGDGGVPDDAPPGYGATCAFTSECSSSLVCVSGRCVYECITAVDCGSGRYCNDLHRCIAGSPPDAGPGDSTLDVGDGKACGIDFDCDDGTFCNGRERCLGGKCAPPAETACDPHATCYVANCDESTRTCKAPTKVGTGGDTDHDGHVDVACGGDDCDDLDATRYKGAPELCDGKDNDCNLLVDDGAVVPRGPVLTAPSSTAGHYGGGGMTIGSKGLALELSPIETPTFTPPAIWFSSIDEATSATTAMVKAFDAGYSGTAGGILSTAGGTSSGLIVWNRPNPPDVQAVATIVAADGTSTKSVTLRSNAIEGARAVWTGSQWLVAWTYDVGYGVERAGFGFVQPDGTSDLRTLPSNATGDVTAGYGYAQIGFSGGTVAVAYPGASAAVAVVLLGASGTVLSGPAIVVDTSLGPSVPIAVAGTTTGFVIIYTQGVVTKAAYVSKAGVVGATAVPVAMGQAFGGSGTFDGAGAVFALTGADGLHMVYARRDLADGLDHVLAYAAATPGRTDLPNVDVVSGKTVLSTWTTSDRTTRFVTAGCATP